MSTRLEAIVLDTHVWLEVAFGRGRFAPRVMRRIDTAAHAGILYVAAITPWEVTMLIRSGKTRVAGPILDWLGNALRATRTAVAPLELAISVDAVELPAWLHQDPADRIIVATTRFLGASLVTRDSAILDYAASARALRVLEPSLSQVESNSEAVPVVVTNAPRGRHGLHARASTRRAPV
jgi:PIN domain nuclease of toxin-antitoxin system